MEVFSFTHGWHDAGTPEWHDPNKLTAFKVKWIIKPTKFGKGGAIEWEQPLAGMKESRMPTFGDVISHPGHVGVFLGRKLYVSSTTWPFLSGLQGEDVVIHVTNDNQEQIYRSPE